jgi:hypothetical protein
MCGCWEPAPFTGSRPRESDKPRHQHGDERDDGTGGEDHTELAEPLGQAAASAKGTSPPRPR